MASVDDRIVHIQFDNAQFQTKIEDTLTSLGKLNKALKFDGAQKGIADVNAAVSKTNFSGMSSAVEGISAKFIALSTIAITTLANLTTKAISAGSQIVKSLSLDPIIAGYKEYELNIQSIQTILANTRAQGTVLSDVTAALDQLNTYSDKTIYNFGQMAKNIGTFSAAGVDLNTSVQSIKGIANLAAISGSSADQASVAMYQLSQAIASGSVKLMDWNSVVNAGMGGKGFQKALFDTGVALKTIPGVPIGTTFAQWTAAGNTFRNSLQDGWVTADVLTTTLQGYTGEMTTAQLEAKGFSAEAAQQMIDLGKTGVDAATKVRTFTGLLSTTKEAIGSGWSNSFRLIIGNFTEATDLFTKLSQTIGGVVSKAAAARNALLQGWQDLGGRTMLIEAFGKAFHNLGEIFKPIREAFREIFPRTTAEQLINVTKSFLDFAKALKPSQETIDSLKSIFKGLFSILDIGWIIIQNGTKFVVDLAKALLGLTGGDFLAFLAKIGNFFSGLRNALVEGGGIAAFFEGLTAVLSAPISLLEKLKNAIGRLFDGFDGNKADGVQSVTGRISDRLENLGRVIDRIKDAWKPFDHFLQKVSEILGNVWHVISGFFSNLGNKIAEVMSAGNYSNVLDTLNTGILAVLTAGIIKWVKNGFNINVAFGGGFLDSIRKSFDQLTGALKAMQLQIKAKALLKIAIAIAVLTASVLVLSMIDSAALTKALAAMSVGFAQLMGAFAILSKMAMNPKTASSFAILSAGMILLGGALFVLALSVKSLSKLNWNELAKGLTGTLALILIVSIAARLLSGQSAHMIAAGIGIAALSVGLVLMSAAVKIFATMSWGEMAKGLGGMAIGLGLISVALHLMPPHMGLLGLGLILIGVGLNLMASSLALFGAMQWDNIARGLVALGGSLAAIAIATSAMPTGMAATGAGLILIGIGLNVFSLALKTMGSMSWEEIARGLTALAGSLLILAIGVTAMNGALIGAIAIGIVAASLIVLAGVLKIFSKTKWSDLIEGLAKLAAALAGLAIIALLIQPAIPAMLGLALALGVLGLAFLAFGAGAMMVAKAFELMGKAGAKGAEYLGKTLEALAKAIPAFAKGLGEGVLEFVQTIANGLGKLIPAISKIIGGILTAIISNLPKIIVLFMKLLDAIIMVVYKYGPQLIDLGIFMLLKLLTGIRDNIYQITTLAVDIVLNFLQALSDRMGEIVTAGITLLLSFLQGIVDNLGLIIGTVAQIITTFITEIGNHVLEVINAGVAVLVQFIQGITDNLVKITNAVGDMIAAFLTGLAVNAQKIMDAGLWLILTLIYGIGNSMYLIVTAAGTMVAQFLNGMTSQTKAVATAATNLIVTLIQEIGKNSVRIVNAGTDALIKFVEGLGKNAVKLADAAFTIVTQFLNGLADVINKRTPELREAGLRLMGAVINGMTFGLAGKAKELGEGMVNVAKGAVKEAKGFLKVVGDPYSLVFMGIGEAMVNGMTMALDADTSVEDSAVDVVSRATDSFKNSLTTLSGSLNDLGEFNPVITPVLDLTRIASDASLISGYIQTSQKIAPNVSLNQARLIASTTSEQLSPTTGNPPGETSGVVFNQTINAPTQLTTADIYKQTRNQITIAKEELAIP